MFVLNEQSDVFIDAMASDHRAQLLFISVYGRDTSVQQFMARLHQSSREGGIDQLTAVQRLGDRPALQVMVGDPKRLEKATGRLPRTGLLGNLVHTWIFDPALLAVDHASRAAWILEPQRAEDVDKAVLDCEAWRLIKDLSPVPLLDDWQHSVMCHVQGRGGFITPRCLGRIQAWRIELPEEFPAWVSESVREGHLPVPSVEAQQGRASPGKRAGTATVTSLAKPLRRLAA